MPLYLRLALPFCALALGVACGFVQLPGALATLAFMALVLGPWPASTHSWRLLVTLYAVLLAAHVLPGFTPWNIQPAQMISADAAPYQLRLSWDKWLMGLTLLAWWLGQPRTAAKQPSRVAPLFILTALMVPALALALGLVAWQPKWPTLLWPWLAINLGVAVLAEELLFRGLLQPWLIRLLGTWPGLLLTALLFGAVHVPFSPLFAMVAAVAGLGYGLVFHYSGRLSLAMALHGVVNLTHFLLLSYPLRLA